MPPKDLQDLFLKGHFGYEGRKQRRFDELVMKLKKSTIFELNLSVCFGAVSDSALREQ